jgi:2-aminoadipate transaminase
MEPEFVSVDRRRQGPRARGQGWRPRGARFAYLLPNFQNPTGRTMSRARRAGAGGRAGAGPAAGRGQPLRRPVVRHPAAAAAELRATPTAAVYLGSFSKVLAPGAAPGLPGGAQGAVPQAAAGQAGGRPAHARASTSASWRGASRTASWSATCPPSARCTRRSAMPCWRRWSPPAGRLPLAAARPAACSSGSSCPAGLDATALLPQGGAGRRGLRARGAVLRRRPAANTLRLSFVTVSPERIEAGVAALAGVLAEARDPEARMRPQQRRFDQLDVFSAGAPARQPAGRGARRRRA